MNRSKDKTRKLILLCVGSIGLFLLIALTTRQPQVALFAAVLVHMIGVFIVAPWKPR